MDGTLNQHVNFCIDRCNARCKRVIGFLHLLLRWPWPCLLSCKQNPKSVSTVRSLLTLLDSQTPTQTLVLTSQPHNPRNWKSCQNIAFVTPVPRRRSSKSWDVRIFSSFSSWPHSAREALCLAQKICCNENLHIFRFVASLIPPTNANFFRSRWTTAARTCQEGNQHKSTTCKSEHGSIALF